MRFSILIFTLLTFWTHQGFAHTPVSKSEPANGATLSQSPDIVRLYFPDPARVVKVTLNRKQKGTKTEKNLKIPSRKPVKQIDLKPVLEGPGTYQVTWRAQGKDGHVVTGGFSYTVLEN